MERARTTSPFAVRGAIEAFYGAFYTFPERKDLIRFLGRHGFNYYLYGPKNDRQHRMRWWDPYPEAVMDDFGEAIHVATGVGVEFCYAISFGVPMKYASQEDFDLITAKLMRFYQRGCRSFGVLLDDITEGFNHAVNRNAFRTVGDAHVAITNRLYRWAQALPEPCRLAVCPSEYWGRAPFSDYLRDFGARLLPGIDVFYSGPNICAHAITVDDVRGFAEMIGRPPVIWDNYPVNDLQMRGEMHIGPLRNRDPRLPEVCRGFVSNLMAQEEASKIPLLTIAEYVRAPVRYEPARAWKRALRVMGTGGSVEPLTRFAETSLRSCLHDQQAPIMDRLTHAALDALKAGESVTESAAVAGLATYLTVLDEAGYHLKNRMRNLRLRDDLLPWIEALEDRIWMARRALSVLQAIETGVDYHPPLRTMKELLKDIQRNPKEIGGVSLIRLADYVLERVARQQQAAAATLTLGGPGTEPGRSPGLQPGPKGAKLHDPAAALDPEQSGDGFATGSHSA